MPVAIPEFSAIVADGRLTVSGAAATPEVDDSSSIKIAELEGVPKGTVKTRIFHAKKLLLRCLGKR